MIYALVRPCVSSHNLCSVCTVTADVLRSNQTTVDSVVCGYLLPTQKHSAVTLCMCVFVLCLYFVALNFLFPICWRYRNFENALPWRFYSFRARHFLQYGLKLFFFETRISCRIWMVCLLSVWVCSQPREAGWPGSSCDTPFKSNRLPSR